MEKSRHSTKVHRVGRLLQGGWRDWEVGRGRQGGSSKAMDIQNWLMSA